MQHLQKTRGTSFKPKAFLFLFPGALFNSSRCLRASVATAPPPIFRTLFQVPYPATPLVATHTKTPGVWGYSSHFGTRRHVDVLTRRGIPVTSSAPILHGVTIHRSLTTIPLTRSLPPYFIASSLPQRAVAFPQQSTTRLLCKAVPSRTMEVHSEAKPASHASVLAGESLNRSTPAG